MNMSKNIATICLKQNISMMNHRKSIGALKKKSEGRCQKNSALHVCLEILL